MGRRAGARMKAVAVRVGGKVVGNYYPRTKTFVKKVFKSKHFFRNLSAWGMDTVILNALKEKGCRKIRVFDREEGILYETTPAQYLRDGTERDFGSGAQVFLNVCLFTTKAVEGHGSDDD